MTVSSGFFNSVNHDRLYDAEQLSSIFDGVIVDGVYENVGEAFNVTAYPDAYNTVLVGTGRAWFDHTWTLNDSRFSITLDPPNEMLGRIDAIVIDVNKERDTRKNSIIYLKGDEATPDFPPTLINTDNHHQYPIAYITRHAEQNGPISQSDIEITVGTGACPIATGVLEAQNLENLMQQLDAEFNEWWEGIKDLLDENVATNLQNQIDEINEKLNGDTALVGLLEKSVAEAFMSGDYGLNVTSYSPTMSVITNPVATDFELQNTISFLPNGEVCSICITYDNREDPYSSAYYADINITNTDGVNTNVIRSLSGYQRGVSTTSTSSGFTHRTIVDAQITLISSDIESYPVKFKYLASQHSVNNSSGCHVSSQIITIQISSSKTVSIDYSEAVSDNLTDLNFDRDEWSMNIFRCAAINKLPDSSMVIPSVILGAWDTGSSPYGGLAYSYTIKISSDELISGRKYEYYGQNNSISGTLANSVAGIYSIYHHVGDKFVSYLRAQRTDTDSGHRIVIDPETLETSVELNASSTYPLPSKYDYDVSYGVETYSLSESEGVTTSEIEAGKSPEIISTKLYPYFLGASNLSEPLPEGTFIAAKDPGGQLYGIASGGQQLAIGTNGGAAMLKTKKPISTSIDISKVVLWQKGFYVSEDYTAYLMVNGVTNRVLSYVLGTAKTASVVKISKGV